MKTLGTILCLGGIALFSVGIWKAQSQSSVEQSAYRFLEALKDGNSARVMAEYSPRIRESLSANPNSPVFKLSPDPFLEYSILSVTENQQETSARVVVGIVKHGYRIRPILHYELQNGQWRIVRTSNLKRDPRWDLRRLKREQQEKNSLADEVNHRFENVAGVSVKRLR